MPKSVKKIKAKSNKKPKNIKVEKHKKVSYKKYFIHYLYCLLIILLLLIASININNYIENQKVLGAKVDATSFINEKEYWEKVISDNPNYIDGYLQLAKVNVELGNREEAQDIIIKALVLDPNSSKIPEVQKELGL